MAISELRQSPTTGIRTLTFLWMDVGSMSIWTMVALAQRRRGVLGHAVVEAHAHGNQEVGVADGFVGGIGPVHAEHTEPLRVIAGERAEAHQGTGHRDAQVLGEIAELFAGIGHDHAAAAEQQGALRIVERVHDLADLGVIGAVGRVVARRLTSSGQTNSADP